MTARVERAYARIAEVGRPEVWIALREEGEVAREAAVVDAALPLAGRLLAVKDNIDVAGLATTAGCAEFAYTPTEDAPAVARLRAAGAVVIGKTNLDQFATGLVGTRSPYGAVRDARRPEFASGGSSSGSAVAVALGIADLALGTDTAGSGRVPAAFGGIVGVKPTLGLVPTRGVVPACRTLDCVSVLAPTVADGYGALWIMAGRDDSDAPAAARTRTWPSDAPLAAPGAVRVGVAADAVVSGYLSPDARAALSAAAEQAEALGFELVGVDVSPLLAAAELLYDGAFVAERHAAFGAFAATHPAAMDPTVRAIVEAAGLPSASTLVADGERLDGLRRRTAQLFADVDVVMLPTVPGQPTIAEVAADPLGVNARLGTFTNFANLLDLAAVALPAGMADGGQFGVTLLAPAFGDALLEDLAARMRDEPRSDAGPGGLELFVVGAHRTGQPLNRQLVDAGARPRGVRRTAACYRLVALDTSPPKPGLVRVQEGGQAIEGELWEVPAGALGPFLSALPGPMALGRVLLSDGHETTGFTCEAWALEGAADITAHGSWPNFLTAGSAATGGADRA